MPALPVFYTQVFGSNEEQLVYIIEELHNQSMKQKMFCYNEIFVT